MTTWKTGLKTWLSGVATALGMTPAAAGASGGMLYFQSDPDGDPVSLRFIIGNKSEAQYRLDPTAGGAAQSPDNSGDWTAMRTPPTTNDLSQTYTLTAQTANLAPGDTKVYVNATQAGAALAEKNGGVAGPNGYPLGVATANSQTPFDFALGV
jgi:hypothetical protein